MPGSIRVCAMHKKALPPSPYRWTAHSWLLRTSAGVLGAGLTGAFLGAAVLAERLAPADPFLSVALPLLPPSAAYPMGTDDLGRDLLAGVLHGARTAALVVGMVTLLAAGIGVSIGACSGYRGGVLDHVLMRVTEFVQVVPRFFLAVVVMALCGPGLDRLILLLGFTSWPAIARVVRAETLSLKHRDFVEAARSLGASVPRILYRHVLPHALPPTVVVISFHAASVLLLEAGLAFLGLGDPTRMSWGYLANNAQRFLRVAWWLAAFPGAAIVLAILGLNFLGDALNDLLRERVRNLPRRR